jgi:hypothetical protein
VLRRPIETTGLTGHVELGSEPGDKFNLDQRIFR